MTSKINERQLNLSLSASQLVETDSSGNIVSSTALPNGVTATTQAQGDNTTKVATTAYVDAAVGGENLWDRSGTDLTPHTSGDNVNLGTGGLKDTNVITAVKLGDSFNTSCATTNKTLIGAINELYNGAVVNPDQNNIIYVRSNGNDSLNGKCIERAVLTLYQGVLNCVAQSPAYNNQFVVKALDAGYDSNISLVPFVHLDAPMMTIRATNLVQDYSVFICRELYGADAMSINYTGGAGTYPSYLKAERMNRGYIYVDVNQGTRYIDIDSIECISTNDAIIVNAGSTLIYRGSNITGKITATGTNAVININANKITGLVTATGTGAIVDLSKVSDISSATFSTSSGGVIIMPVKSTTPNTWTQDNTFTSTTEATSSAGAIRTSGGISAAKNLYAGGSVVSAHDVSVGGYNRLMGSGGNSNWYQQGQFAAFGDGLSIMYNMYADPSTGTIVYPVNFYSTRVHVGYDYFAVYASSAYSTPPTAKLAISRSSGYAVEVYNNLLVNSTIDASSSAGAIYTAGGITAAKKVYAGTGLSLPVQTGGTRTDLLYYEKSSFSATFISNAASNSSTVTILVEQIGSEIFLYIPAIGLTGNNSGTGNIYATTSAIPARFRPSSQDIYVCLPMVFTNTNTRKIGTAIIGWTGNLTIYYGEIGTVFPICPTSATMGTGNATCQYRITALT